MEILSLSLLHVQANHAVLLTIQIKHLVFF
jgi:hypothetical protein